MREEQPTLLDQNVHIWVQDARERRMIRTLDGKVRAVLSDRYRRLNNLDLAEAVPPILQRLPDVCFESVELAETKMYIKVVTPRIQAEMAPGDLAQDGIVNMNSEVGHNTLSVQPLLYRLLCRNDLIAFEGGLRKTHLGRFLPSDEEAITLFRDDTLAANDHAFFLKVRDVVQAAVLKSSFRQVAEKMRRMIGIRLTGDPVKTFEGLANHYALSDTEGAGVLRHLIVEGELSGYGLVNAVTLLAGS